MIERERTVRPCVRYERDRRCHAKRKERTIIWLTRTWPEPDKLRMPLGDTCPVRDVAVQRFPGVERNWRIVEQEDLTRRRWQYRANVKRRDFREGHPPQAGRGQLHT